jgi:hypothetical protein
MRLCNFTESERNLLSPKLPYLCEVKEEQNVPTFKSISCACNEYARNALKLFNFIDQAGCEVRHLSRVVQGEW